MDLQRVLTGIARAARAALGLLVALILLIEDAAWAIFRPLTQALASLAVVRRIEALALSLSPRAYLVLFLVPFVVVWPIKLIGLALMASGRFILGLVVLVLAEVIGAALAVRLWTLGRERLLTISWFAGAYGLFLRWREALYAWAGALAWVAAARALIHRVRDQARALIARLGLNPGRPG